MADEHEGMGGSYAINEAGEKVLVSRTDHAVMATPELAPAPISAPRKNKPTPAVVSTDKLSNEVKA